MVARFFSSLIAGSTPEDLGSGNAPLPIPGDADRPGQSAHGALAIGLLPLAMTSPATLFGWSAGKIWQQVSDAVCSAAMNDVRLTQFACLVVVVGLFLLWWRK